LVSSLLSNSRLAFNVSSSSAPRSLDLGVLPSCTWWVRSGFHIGPRHSQARGGTPMGPLVHDLCRVEKTWLDPQFVVASHPVPTQFCFPQCRPNQVAVHAAVSTFVSKPQKEGLDWDCRLSDRRERTESVLVGLERHKIHPPPAESCRGVVHEQLQRCARSGMYVQSPTLVAPSQGN
jgi:hypothetical protein